MKQSPTNYLSTITTWIVRIVLTFVGLLIVLFVCAIAAPHITKYLGFVEIWQKSQGLRDQPSLDTTPVEFTYLGVKYRVPRNYIVHMDGPLTPPTFKVTFPGFEPLTEKTRQCLTQPQAFWPPGCVPIEFWLGGNGVHPTVSEEELYNNEQKLPQAQRRKQGPYGFDLYEAGVEEHRVQTYRKKLSTRTLLITCIYYGAGASRGAVCTNESSPLPNGNDLSYRIDLNLLENAEKIDDGIRALIDSFTLKGDKP